MLLGRETNAFWIQGVVPNSSLRSLRFQSFWSHRNMKSRQAAGDFRLPERRVHVPQKVAKRSWSGSSRGTAFFGNHNISKLRSCFQVIFGNRKLSCPLRPALLRKLFLVTVNFLVPCFENMRKLKQNTVNMIWRKFRSNQCIGFNFTDGQNSIQVDSNALLLKQPEFSGSSLLVHQTSRIPNVRTGPLGIENLLEFGTPWILNTLVCLSSSLEICSWKLNFQVQVVSGLGDWKSWIGNANELASYRSGDYGRTSLPSSTLTFPNKVVWRHERPK